MVMSIGIFFILNCHPAAVSDALWPTKYPSHLADRIKPMLFDLEAVAWPYGPLTTWNGLVWIVGFNIQKYKWFWCYLYPFYSVYLKVTVSSIFSYVIDTSLQGPSRCHASLIFSIFLFLCLPVFTSLLCPHSSFCFPFLSKPLLLDLLHGVVYAA